MRVFNTIALLVIIFLNGCIQSENDKKENGGVKQIEVTDAQGNRVALEDVAKRIVCLFDPSIDVIYMLQAQDKLVGINVDTYFDKELYDYYKHIDPRIASKELATPGSNDMINVESVLTLAPDLVIAQNLSPSIISTLNSMGIAVYLSAASSYADLLKEMKDISLLVGKEDRGDTLIQFTKETAKALEEKAQIHQRDHLQKKAYFSWANGKIFSTAGRNSMMHDCLVLAGVENACPTAIDKPNINPETLIDWNPDMIVMWNDSPDLFYNRKELSAVTAINSKQIFNLMPMFYYNPHTFKALCAATAINGWAYPDATVDVAEEVKAIIIKLYGDETGKELIKYYL